MVERYIDSLGNPLIKKVVKYQQKASERKKDGLFVIEGVREVSLALQSGVEITSLFVCNEYYRESKEYPVNIGRAKELISVSVSVYDKMAYRAGAEGILAIARQFDTSLDRLQLSPMPLLVVIEAVEKPGNLGAILRTADAAGVDGLIICDQHTDIFNPNAIRSGLGCVFSVKVAVCSREEFFKWSLQQGISTMIASVQATMPYYDASYTKPVALAFGTEANGLSPQWYEFSREQLKIPMAGQIDSLNVSVSAAILIFEAVRQRSKM